MLEGSSSVYLPSKAVLKNFSERNVHSKESIWDLWIPIVNKDVSNENRADCDSGKTGYSLTKKLQIAKFEKKGRASVDCKIGAAMHVWPGWSANFLNVDKGSRFRSKIAATGGPLLLTASISEAQTRLNGIRSSLFKPSGLEEGNTDACPGSQNYFCYLEEKNLSAENSSDEALGITTSFHVC